MASFEIGAPPDFQLDDEAIGDEHGLLDWDQYYKLRRKRFCGIDCTGLVNFFPALRSPDWWLGLSKQTKRMIAYTCSILLGIIILIAFVGVLKQMPNPSPNNQVYDNVQSSKTHQPIIDYDVSPDAQAMCSWAQFDLPQIVKPSKYELNIKMVEGDGQFEFTAVGDVTIEVYLAEPADCIVLHAEEMTISNTTVNKVKGQLTAGKQTGQQIIQLENAIPQGPAFIRMEFSYLIRTGRSGFYRSLYTDMDGIDHFIASTQFQSTYARLAFPCFDEPAFKASFSISITADSDYVVLSNMPGDSKDAGGGTTMHTFEETPPMSTQVVAWIVGELEAYETTMQLKEARVPLKVWGSLQRQDELQYAAESAATIVPVLEQMFDVIFPLPKLDLVGVPEFAAGAMENWGLITFREVDLMLPDIRTSKATRRVREVVGHELVHQWMGDFVTPEWWGELWLSESFAEYFDSNVIEWAYPQSKTMSDFYTTETLAALHLDASPAAAPMHRPRETVQSAADIQDMFDDISYNKGACVLRMMRTYLTAMDGIIGMPGDLIQDDLLQRFKRRRMLGQGHQGGPDRKSQKSEKRGKHGGGRKHGNAGGGPPPSQEPLFDFSPQKQAPVSVDDVVNDAVPGQLPNPDPLLRGISAYLQKYKFGVGSSDKFLQCVQDESSVVVTKVFDGWVHKTGFPVLRVWEGEKGVFVKQTLWRGGKEVECVEGEGDDVAPFDVPVHYSVGGKIKWMLLDTCQRVSLTHKLNQVIKVNKYQYGYYRVQYDDELHMRLVDTAQTVPPSANDPAALSAADMAGMLDDAFFQASHGLVNHGRGAQRYMELLQALGLRESVVELQLTPWRVAVNHVARLKRVLNHTCAEAFDRNVREQVVLSQFSLWMQHDEPQSKQKPCVHALKTLTGLAPVPRGAPGAVNVDLGRDDGRERMMQEAILKLGSDVGDACLKRQAYKALRMGEDVFKSADEFNPDAWYLLLKIAISGKDGDSVSDYVMELMEVASSAQEHEHYLQILASSANLKTSKAVLDMTLTPAIRSQDVTKTLQLLAGSSPDVLDTTYNYVLSHLDEYEDKSGEATQQLRQKWVLKLLAGVVGFSDKEEHSERLLKLVDEFEAFDDVPEFVQSAVHSVKLYGELRDKLGAEVCEYVMGQGN